NRQGSSQCSDCQQLRATVTGISLASCKPVRHGAASASRSGPEAEERVVQLVNQALHSHEIRPGDRLVERELSMATGASRLAVRNALIRLSQAGLVDLNRNKGATVVECTQDLAHQIMSARIVNETAALKALAGNLDEAGRARL